MQFATGLMRDRGYAQLRRDACVVDKVLPFTSARKRMCSFAWTPDDVDVDDDEKIRVRSIHWFPYDRVRVVNADP